MLNAYQRYVCFVPDSEDMPTIKYRSARIYYETNHFAEAAVLFKDIAYNHSDEDLAVFAANLYLDSLNVIGEYCEPPRASCYDEMNDNIEPLFGVYCKTHGSQEGSQRRALRTHRAASLRPHAQEGGGPQATNEFHEGRAAVRAHLPQVPELREVDEVLFNASISFEAARLLGRAIKVRSRLDREYPESEWSRTRGLPDRRELPRARHVRHGRGILREVLGQIPG